MKKFETACRMALDLTKDYTWKKYCELIDYCTDNEIEFYHDEEEATIYIKDYSFKIEN